MLSLSEAADTLDLKPHESPLHREFVTDPWVPDDGMLRLREQPEVDEAAVRRFRFSL
jgi:hypothetical protein